MTIFASDLDRTLIYSKGFLEPYNEKEEILNAEQKEEKNISFVSTKIDTYLKEISKKTVFIPVTTRSEEEYHRVHWVKGFKPRLAIISNGGKILVEDQIDQEWASLMKQKFNALSFPQEKVKDTVLSLFEEEQFSRIKFADNFIWVFVFKNTILSVEEKRTIEELKQKFENSGWELFRTGRKLYILPSFLTKWNALNYVNQKYFNTSIIAAGDSLMDYEMLQKADHGFTFGHGELTEVKDEHIFISSQNGIYAAEDCLEKIIQKII